jgi:hypothetical protein
VFRKMDFSKEVSKSDKEHLSSKNSDQSDDQRISSERANQNIDILVSSVTVNERLIAFSAESNDITATSLARPANNVIPSPTVQPQVCLGNLLPIRSCRNGSNEQHLHNHIPLLMHLDPHNTG